MVARPKILAFAGSLRKDSYNKKLIKIAVKGAEEAGGDVTLIDLLDFQMPIYNEDIETATGLPETAKELKKLFLVSDGLLLSCPEYNSSISGVLKNTIDWVSRMATPDEEYLICFKNKIVTLMSASQGPLGGIRGLVTVRSIFGNINSIVLPRQKCIPTAQNAFNPDGSLKNPKDQEDILHLGRQHVEFLKSLNKTTS